MSAHTAALIALTALAGGTAAFIAAAPFRPCAERSIILRLGGLPLQEQCAPHRQPIDIDELSNPEPTP